MKFDKLILEANEQFEKTEIELEKGNEHYAKEWFFAYFFRLFIPLSVIIVWLIIGMVYLNGTHLWGLCFITGALNGLVKDEFGGLLARAILLMSIHVFMSDVLALHELGKRTGLLKDFLIDDVYLIRNHFKNKDKLGLIVRFIGLFCGIIIGLWLTGYGTFINSIVLICIEGLCVFDLIRDKGILLTVLRAFKSTKNIERDALMGVSDGCIITFVLSFIKMLIDHSYYPVIYGNKWSVVLACVGSGFLGLALCMIKDMINDGGFESWKDNIRKIARRNRAKKAKNSHYSLDTAVSVKSEIELINDKIINDENVEFSREIVNERDDLDWHYSLEINTDGHVFDAEVMDHTCYFYSNGKKMDHDECNAEVLLFGWSKDDKGVVYKTMTSLYFDLFQSGLYAQMIDGDLRVTLVDHLDNGVAQFKELQENEYMVISDDNAKMIVMNKDISKFCSLE